MAEENREQQDDNQPQDESQKTQPAQPNSTPAAQHDDDDVQAYGEPSDGSGGTKDG